MSTVENIWPSINLPLAIAFLSLLPFTKVAGDEARSFKVPEYPAEFVDPCTGKSVGASCSIFLNDEWQERRCVEARERVLICAGGEPKELDPKLFEACDGKVEKDACVAPIKDRRTGKYLKNKGHCNRYRPNRLICLPGEWPWRD